MAVPKRTYQRGGIITFWRNLILIFCCLFGVWRYQRLWRCTDLNNISEDLIETINEVIQEIQNINEQLALVQNSIEKINADHQQLNERFYTEKQFSEKLVEEQIKFALNKYDADKTGLIDYALESGGGRIIALPGTTNYVKTWTVPLLGELGFGAYNPPEIILRPGNQPGECFAFAGSEGRFRIRLSASIQITAVTLEHVPSDIVSDISSAPRDFIIYGLNNKHANTGVFLGNFQYDLRSSIQTFYISTVSKKYKDEAFYQIIELHVKSNQGHPVYTCLYRIRVHGTE